MNILLTDTQSTSPDWRETPTVGSGKSHEFSGLLRRQLPADRDNVSQVSEFKELLSDSPGSMQAPGIVAEVPVADAWRDFLAQQHPGPGGEIDSLAIASTQASLADAATPGIDATGVTGDVLPMGGNLLPDNPAAAVAPGISPAGVITDSTQMAIQPDSGVSPGESNARGPAIGISLPGRNPALAKESARFSDRATAPTTAADGKPGHAEAGTIVGAVPTPDSRGVTDSAATFALHSGAGEAGNGDALETGLASMSREVMVKETVGGRIIEVPVQAGMQPPQTAQQQTLLPRQLETMSLSRQADSAEWGNGLGERVGWMINHKQNSAIIRLDPPLLGKLDVQVKIADDATTITIQTQHAQTRDLIETASVRLRDFLQENGYQNVNVDVSQRQDQRQADAQSDGDDGDQRDQIDQQRVTTDQQSVGRTGYLQGEGLLDTFA